MIISYNWSYLFLKFSFNGSQLAKMKKHFPSISLSWNLYGRSSFSKKFQLCFKNYDFCEYVRFGAISWKFDILSITAQSKFESKNPFPHIWHM